MCWCRALLLVLISSPVWADAGDYILGAGIEGDSESDVAVAILGDLAIRNDTWVSAMLAHTKIDLPNGETSDNWQGSLGIDHYFNPLGIRLNAGYWGDSDLLDSYDTTASLYWRIGTVSLAGIYEYRDFTFDFPGNRLYPPRRLLFDATGIGASLRFTAGESFSVGLKGIRYDYNRDFSRIPVTDLRSLLSVSRLSLLTSLVDYNTTLTLGLQDDVRLWEFDFATWKGEVDRSKTNSYTLRLTLPAGKRGDIELGLGFDSSDDYGNATLFSVFGYFYGD